MFRIKKNPKSARNSGAIVAELKARRAAARFASRSIVEDARARRLAATPAPWPNYGGEDYPMAMDPETGELVVVLLPSRFRSMVSAGLLEDEWKAARHD